MGLALIGADQFEDKLKLELTVTPLYRQVLSLGFLVNFLIYFQLIEFGNTNYPNNLSYKKYPFGFNCIQ